MEVTILGLAIVLGLVHILAAAQAATAKYGIKYNLSSRDAKVPELDGVAGRLDRASKNYLETFPFFAAAVLGVAAIGASSSTTELGAQIYLGARVLYLPVYAFNITVVRTLIWLISLLGIAMVMTGIF